MRSIFLLFVLLMLFLASCHDSQMESDFCFFLNLIVLVINLIASLITIFMFIIDRKLKVILKKIFKIASLQFYCFIGNSLLRRKTDNANKKKIRVEYDLLDIIQNIVCTMNCLSNSIYKKSLLRHLAVIISSLQDEIFIPGQRHPWLTSLNKKNFQAVAT